MAVNGVNGTTKVEQSQPKGEQRVVEQEEEEMFEFHSAIEVAADLAEKWYENVTIGSIVGKGAELAEKSGMKAKLHQVAEKARKFKQEHPILGMGVLPTAVIALDNLVNGDKE